MGNHLSTKRWIVGRTTLILTWTGRLVNAKNHRTEAAAKKCVAAENRMWQEVHDQYIAHGNPLPPQMTEKERLRHMVWDGIVRPTVDGWGEPVKW